MAQTKLYAVPASHPCAVVERALELKGIEFERVDLIPMTHPLIMRARFGKRTVPGVRFADGTKLSGSPAILRELDRRVPEPRLVPDDADVAEAERWGEDVLQPLVRRVLWTALRRSPKSMTSYAEGADLPIPVSLAALGAVPVSIMERRLNRSTDDAVRADLTALPGLLDRADELIAKGVLGAESPTAADLQVASCVRLLATLADLRPLMEGRPVITLARRLFPLYPGSAPVGALPADWLP